MVVGREVTGERASDRRPALGALRGVPALLVLVGIAASFTMGAADVANAPGARLLVLRPPQGVALAAVPATATRIQLGLASARATSQSVSVDIGYASGSSTMIVE